MTFSCDPALPLLPAQLGQEALWQTEQTDVVTGLRSRFVTEYGRPDFGAVMRDLAVRHRAPGRRAKIGVFVCGSPVRAACTREEKLTRVESMVQLSTRSPAGRRAKIGVFVYGLPVRLSSSS